MYKCTKRAYFLCMATKTKNPSEQSIVKLRSMKFNRPEVARIIYSVNFYNRKPESNYSPTTTQAKQLFTCTSCQFNMLISDSCQVEMGTVLSKFLFLYIIH